MHRRVPPRCESNHLSVPRLPKTADVVCVPTVRSVEEASAKFYAELRCHFYTTPKSYLDLISLYLQLLQERK